MPTEKINVFLIDDDLSTIRLLAHSFRHMQETWRLSFFNDPEHALSEVSGTELTIIVSDWHMPNTDGLALCAKVREKVLPENGGFTYFILFTANNDQDDAVHALESGIDDFLVKPVNIKELIARIKIGIRVLQAERNMWRANEKLKMLASTDILTGLLNRRAGQDLLDQEFAAVKRGMQAVSVMMADLDYFKKINDTYGHNAGDTVLKEISRRLKNGLRKYDFVIRWGGEEFLIVCKNTQPEDARNVANQVLSLVSSQAVIINDDLQLDVTVSIGTACIQPNEDMAPYKLIAKADKALYEAKESGKNCVRVWSTDVVVVA